MTIKRKHNEVTSKTKYEALKVFDKIDLTKKLQFSSTFPKKHFLLGTNQSRPLSVEQIVSEQPAEVFTDGDDENEDEESDEKLHIPEEMKLTRQSKL